MENKAKKKTSNQRNHLYKLLESFNERDLKMVKRYAELLNTANDGKDKNLLNLLDAAQYDVKEMNEKTIKEILKARKEFKNGKSFSLAQVKNELGI